MQSLNLLHIGPLSCWACSIIITIAFCCNIANDGLTEGFLIAMSITNQCCRETVDGQLVDKPNHGLEFIDVISRVLMFEVFYFCLSGVRPSLFHLQDRSIVIHYEWNMQQFYNRSSETWTYRLVEYRGIAVMRISYESMLIDADNAGNAETRKLHLKSH